MSQKAITVYSGFITTPGGERIQVDFETDAAATDEQISHAFVCALAQQASIDWVPMGSIPVIDLEHVVQQATM